MKKSVVWILILFYGCGTTDSDSDSKIDEPTTQGIVMTDETGLEIGTWRSPSSPSPQSDNFRLMIPYPNPSSSTIVIAFETGVSGGNIEIWMLPVRLPNEKESGYVKEFGPEAVADSRIETLVNERYQAGHHQLFLDASYLPRGFYRVYAETNVETLWHDIFIGSSGESYQDMIDYLNNLND